MRRSWLLALLVFLPALAGILLVVPHVSSERTSLRHEEGIGFVLPSPLYRVVALEFKGILADVIFSRTMTWYGGKVIRDEKLSAEEWDWIYANMDVATDLDPYFNDPYLFGAVNLAWEADQVEAANALLEKALEKRDWDWSIPFYLGFNHFYFLQDNSRAAAYLMQASERPGGSGVLAQLATRLLYQERNTENAIIFLREIIRKTEEGQTRDIYLIRLEALEGILLLLGRGLGFARYKNQQSYCAILVDLSVSEDAQIRLMHATICADTGLAVDPDGVINQLEGGFIQAASWTLKEAVDWDSNGVKSLDWDTYPILRFSEVPTMSTHLIDARLQPTLGVGEASTGPAPGAIANAVFDAVGLRVRSLPINSRQLRLCAAQSES
jgi:hypothetical protein